MGALPTTYILGTAGANHDDEEGCLIVVVEAG